MSTIELSIAILMIAALLIGFIIGLYIRRSATRDKYERKIDDLILQDDHMSSEVQVNSVNYENATKHLEHLQSKSSAQKQQIADFTNLNHKLTSNIEKAKLSKKELENNLHMLDKEIKTSSNELEILNSQKDEILHSVEKIEEYEEKISQKNREIEEVSDKISTLLSERESLNKQINNLEDEISTLDKDISIENDKIKAIEDEFEVKKSNIIKDVELTSQKALNYQYALDYVNEKLTCGETIKASTIDNIIRKNEETKIFANLIKKLFGKSAKYIKEGK
jgi:chromosome segregation ATPase